MYVMFLPRAKWRFGPGSLLLKKFWTISDCAVAFLSYTVISVPQVPCCLSAGHHSMDWSPSGHCSVARRQLVCVHGSSTLIETGTNFYVLLGFACGTARSWRSGIPQFIRLSYTSSFMSPDTTKRWFQRWCCIHVTPGKGLKEREL